MTAAGFAMLLTGLVTGMFFGAPGSRFNLADFIGSTLAISGLALLAAGFTRFLWDTMP